MRTVDEDEAMEKEKRRMRQRERTCTFRGGKAYQTRAVNGTTGVANRNVMKE